MSDTRTTTEMFSAMESSTNSGCPSGKAMAMSFSELAPKVAPPDSLEEDMDTCVDSGSSNNGDETFIDSGSSSNGEEEATWTCSSEEDLKLRFGSVSEEDLEMDAVKAGECASSKQPFRVEDALESNETKPQPTRTKLSSSALVFVPGASPAPVSGMKSVQAGRELLTLLKGNSQDGPSEVPSETVREVLQVGHKAEDCYSNKPQRTPLRSKLSSKAQAFVPRGNFVQTTGFTPVVQLLPTLLIPMCTPNEGFDDSPRATPRATLPADQQEMTNDPNLSTHQEHPTDSIQQPVESEEVASKPFLLKRLRAQLQNQSSSQSNVSEVVPKPPPKVCWADLYEDEDDISNDLWLDEGTKNGLLSLS